MKSKTAGSVSPTKQLSGLPDPDPNHYGDVHMATAKGLTSMQSFNDIRMGTAKGSVGDDVRMDTVKGGTTFKQGGAKVWERELLDSPEVKRKATVAQLCML